MLWRDLRAALEMRAAGLDIHSRGRCSRLLPILDGSACQPKVVGRREHVAVVGPHVAFTEFLRSRKVHGVCGTYEEIAWSGYHQRASPPQ